MINIISHLEKMAAFAKARDKRPIYKVIRQYMNMLKEMLTLIGLLERVTGSSIPKRWPSSQDTFLPTT